MRNITRNFLFIIGAGATLFGLWAADDIPLYGKVMTTGAMAFCAGIFIDMLKDYEG